MGNESSGLSGGAGLELLMNLAQLEEQLRGRGGGGDGSEQAQAHAWDPRDCSDNMSVSADHMTVRRGPGTMGALSGLMGQTDMVRGKRGYISGIHLWEIHWPRGERGSHAVIGVATTEAPVKCPGYKALVGSNDQSLGWDITHNVGIYNSCVISKYPDNCSDDFQAPDRVLAIFNANEGTLGFKDPASGTNYGLCLSGLGLFKRSGKKLYPAVSMTKNGASVKIRYLGDSETSGPPAGLRPRSPLKPAAFPSGNYSFHTNSGGNIRLSNQNKTATRTSGLDEGVVVTSSPLKENTLFEVRLDRKGHNPLISHSFEIGITSNDPKTLRLPDTMTDLKFGRNWMISGNKLAYNNKEIQAFGKLNLNDLEQGTFLGLVLTDQRQIQIFINGELKAKCNLDIPRTLYGVIDVYGRAEQVTIIDRPTTAEAARATAEPTRNRADQVVDGLKLAIQKLKEKKTNSVNEVNMVLAQNVLQAYAELTDSKHQTLLVEKFDELGGATALAEYLDFLIKRGREIEEVNKCFMTALSVAVNFSNSSLKFSSSLGKTNLFAVMINDIKKFVPRYMDSLGTAKKLVYWLATLHNCSKATENRHPLRKVKSVDVLKEILSKKHDTGIQVLSLVGLVNVLFEHEISSLEIKEVLLDKLAFHLKEAVNKTGDMTSVITYEPADEKFTFNALELAMAVQSSAHNLRAGEYLVKQGVCESLMMFVEKGNRNDKEIALGAMWQLSTPQTIAKVMQLNNIMGKLRRLKESDEEEVCQAATRLQIKLTDLTSRPSTGTSGQRLPTAAPSDCEFRRHCQSFVDSLKISDAFFDLGFTTCYCAACHATKGDDLYYTRGQPPQTYGLPIGWYRLGLKVPPKVQAHNAFEKWHRAYHGTNADRVAKILEVGEILIPGDVALGGVKLAEKEGHFKEGWKPENFDTKQIFVSPSIRYAGHAAYAAPHQYTDSRTKKNFTARVAFQILIRPGSYLIAKETVGAKAQIDPKFSNQELEWSTKERGSVIIYGLLVKLEEDKTKARASIFSGDGATGN